MKYGVLLLVIAFAGAVFGQDVQPASGENPIASNWSKLGPTVEGTRGFTLHGRGIRINQSGQYELWVKIVPNSRDSFVRRYGLPRETAYVHQYAIIDCEKKYLSLEKTALFSSSDGTVNGRVESLTPSSRRNAVRSGSIGESIFKYVCVEPTALPMTKTL